VQNFVAQSSDIETVLSEARKTSTAMVAAHQFMDQVPGEMRAALLSVGTHVFFQLSSADASHVSQMLDSGRSFAGHLKNLSQRHAIVKTGSESSMEVRVPTVHEPQVDWTDLLNRVRYMRGRVRAHIERDIAERRARLHKNAEEDLQ